LPAHERLFPQHHPHHSHSQPTCLPVSRESESFSHVRKPSVINNKNILQWNANSFDFFRACRLKLGMSDAQMFEPADILHASGKATLQIAETLRNFILVVKSTQRNTTVVPVKANAAASSSTLGTASSATQSSSQLQFNSKITLTSSSTLSLPSTFVSLSSLPGFAPSPLPWFQRVSFIICSLSLLFSLCRSDASKPTPVEASSKKLSMFKMAVPIDEEGNLFRCVDSQTKRVTVQRLEIVTPDYKDIEDLIQFLARSTFFLYIIFFFFSFSFPSFRRCSPESYHLDRTTLMSCTFRLTGLSSAMFTLKCPSTRIALLKSGL